MLNHSNKDLDESETMKRRSGDIIDQNTNNCNDKTKTCADCGTNKTPLWRGGPSGPKSLCNACGIRNSKKTRGGGGGDDKKPKKPSFGGGGDLKRSPKYCESVKEKMMIDLGMKQRSTVEKQLRKLGEEEQAALLLMALSYGSLYA